MDDEEESELELILQAGEHNHQNLSATEKKFIEDTRERFEKWGAETRLSVKQWAWLRTIYVKC